MASKSAEEGFVVPNIAMEAMRFSMGSGLVGPMMNIRRGILQITTRYISLEDTLAICLEMVQ